MTLYAIFKAATLFLRLIEIAILAYCVLSWFVPSTNGLFRWLHGFISPFVSPFRRIGMWFIQKTRIPFDLTYWIAIIVIDILQNLIWRIYYALLF